MTEIVLEDLLRRDWRNELLRYPAEGEGPAHVVDGDREVAAQVWTDAVGQDRLCFLADLPALSCRTLSVAPEAAETATDLEVAEKPGRVWLRTSRFGVRLPLGNFSAGDIPPPVTCMRWGDDTVFGGGRWFGESPARLESRLTASGPVLAEVCVQWTWADGETGSLHLELAAGDCRALWECHSSSDTPTRGWELSISGLGPLILHGVEGQFFKNTWGIEQGQVGDVRLDDKWAGMLTRLSPWRDWWDDQSQTRWLFKTPDRGFVLQAESTAAGDWVEPEPPGTFAPWEKRLHKLLPLCREEEGDIFLRIDGAAGWRKWLFGAAGDPVGRELQRVNDMVLDWQSSRARPFLVTNTAEIASRRRPVDDPLVQELLTHADEDLDTPYRYGSGSGQDFLQNEGDDHAIAAWLLTGDPDIAECVHLVDRLRRRLNWLGDFDLMRYTMKVALFFDLVGGSDLVELAEQRVFRAQMAYLGYLLADPGTWSMERGYRSGNLNMSVARILGLGIVACAIPAHPEAPGWAAYATACYRQWLQDTAGPRGEWPESMHYIHVSTNDFMQYALAARNAGFADLLAEGQLKRVMLYAAKLHGPPDPRGEAPTGPVRDHRTRRAGTRGRVPLGRAGTTGSSFGHYGILARATADSDPDFSKTMQWLYRETGWNECYVNEGLRALTHIYPDRSLPAAAPDWNSEQFTTAIVMRDATGTDREDYLLVDAGAPFTSAGEQGGLMLWFWRGVPVLSRFAGGYDERAEALISGVSRAVPRRPDRPATWSDVGRTHATVFTALPACDYAVLNSERGPASRAFHQYPPAFPTWPRYHERAGDHGLMRWQRQLLFVKDDGAGSFTVLRDGVCGEPGAWKLWTLSHTVSAAGESATTGPRQLAGPAFTAFGRFGVDLDIFLAAPMDSARHTLRYRRDYGTREKLLQGFVDEQDLLHVEVPAGDCCYAALVPHDHHQPTPAIDTIADGRIIRLRRGETTTHLLLADTADPIRAGGIECRARAALVRQSPGRTTMALPVGGELHAGDHGVRSAGPVEVVIDGNHATVRLPADEGVRVIDLFLPGEWHLPSEPLIVFDPQLDARDGFWRLQLLAAEHAAITLRRD